MTNRGVKAMVNTYFRADATDTPTTFRMALVTSAVVPTVDTALLSELTQIATGNGYTTVTSGAGLAVERSSVGFDTITQDDTNNRAFVQIKDLTWTASGTFPASGNPARYAVLVDDEASPQVIAVFDLGNDVTLVNGQPLILQNYSITGTN